MIDLIEVKEPTTSPSNLRMRTSSAPSPESLALSDVARAELARALSPDPIKFLERTRQRDGE
jgi:hypothetical protein